MPDKTKDMWLKVLIGFIFTILLLIVTAGSASLNDKLDEDTFNRHEKYQTEQFGDIKKSLDRIEKKI